jgi:hypothetical protein
MLVIAFPFTSSSDCSIDGPLNGETRELAPENVGLGLNPGVELAPPRRLVSNWRDRRARKNLRNVADTCQVDPSGCCQQDWRYEATEHLNGVLSEEQRIDNPFQAGARRNDWHFWLWRQMPGLRAGQAELTLQVVTGDKDVLHRHLRLDVTE